MLIFHKIYERIQYERIKNLKEDIISSFIIILSIFIFFLLNLEQHYSFKTYAFDLGIYIQALFSTTKGYFLFENPDSILAGVNSFFGVHFSPLTLLLVPVFNLHPKAETLFIIQEIAIGLAFIYIYKLSNTVINNKGICLIILISYIFNPLIHSAIMFPFHIEIFLPAFIFSSLYYMKSNSFYKFFFSLILITLTIDFAIFLALSIALYAYIQNFINIYKIKDKGILNKMFIMNFRFIIPILFSIIMIYIAIEIISYFGPLPLSKGEIFNILGNNYKDIFINFLTSPYLVLKSISYDLILKVATFLIIILPLLPYVFNDFYSWITSLPLILLLFLTTLSSIYVIGHHIQGLFFTPIFYFIGINGIKKIIDNGTSFISITKRIALFSSISFLLLSPMIPLDLSLSISPHLGVSYRSRPEISARLEFGHELLQLIPSNASVLASDTIFPHVASNVNAYLSLPEGAEPDYAIADFSSNDYFFQVGSNPSFATQFEDLLKSNKYGIVGYANSYILIKKGYTDKPVIFFPFNLKFDSSNITSGNFEKYIENESKIILKHNKLSKTFIFGPYINLPPGSYDVTFIVKAIGIIKEYSLAKFDIVTDLGNTIIGEYILYGYEVDEGSWFQVNLSFVTPISLKNIEFRIVDVSDATEELFLDYISVKQNSLQIFQERKELTLSADKFILIDGIEEGKIYIRNAYHSKYFFFSGPYISLNKGHYKSSVFLKIIPLEPLSEGQKLLTLDVVANRSNLNFTVIDVLAESVKSNEWFLITFEFELDDNYIDVEIRCSNISKEVNIFFSKVIIDKLG